MLIIIGNGFLKSEIFINFLRNMKEVWWKVLWEKIKDFFFFIGKVKVDCCLYEMLFVDCIFI